jgi:hypothetical protein
VGVSGFGNRGRGFATEEHRQECLCYGECRDDFESKNVGSKADVAGLKARSTVASLLGENVHWTLLVGAQGVVLKLGETTPAILSALRGFVTNLRC